MPLRGLNKIKALIGIWRIALLGAMMVTVQIASASAIDLNIFAPRSIGTVLNEIGPQFERASGYDLKVTTDIAATLAKRINDGHSFDVFVGPPSQMDQLIRDNKIIAGTRTSIAHSGIGAEVRAGASKPDISSVTAFKRTLLQARSIGYLKQEGTSGAYLAELFEKMGIAEEIKAKAIRPEADIVSELVARGEIELGLVVITQILTTPGVEFVGPIPYELQSYVRWSGGVATRSAVPTGAMDLIRFLIGTTASPVFRSQGMEPG